MEKQRAANRPIRAHKCNDTMMMRAKQMGYCYWKCTSNKFHTSALDLGDATFPGANTETIASFSRHTPRRECLSGEGRRNSRMERVSR